MLVPSFVLAVLALGFCSARAAEESNIKHNAAVRYEDFGARGDGKTDDFEAITKAHAHANESGLPVKADDGATYYLGGQDKTIDVQTDTYFGKAKFIIDDRSVENRGAPVFQVSSTLKMFKLDGIKSLEKNQCRIEATLPGSCLITAVNSHIKHYIRYGNNQNSGSSQTDVFLVDADGNVDMQAPIIWNFEQITEIEARPVDTTILTIRGGRFTTIANGAESKYTYYSRNIAIRRSNVEIVGLQHYVVGEGDHGAPYGGFIHIGDCAGVTVRDCIFTGHKTYRSIGSSGSSVSMGTYDIQANRAINVSFINCRQSNNIKDGRYWGIMASNYSKNILYDGCTLSRFDAHKGVANATIRNSTLGHAGLNAIGHGILTVENTTVYGRSFINMRSDYGSTWEGEFIIRNCTFVPASGSPVSASLISGANPGQHDFGYTCFMPERITFDSLRIDDAKHPADYRGPSLFSDFNPKLENPDYVGKYPIVRTKEVILKNVTTASKKPLRLSDNPLMFKDTKVRTLDSDM